MRLVDLLLVLMCEGRHALSKVSARSLYSRVSGSGRLDASGPDRFHRQVIDAVRNKDMGTLIEAVELLGESKSTTSIRKLFMLEI